MSIQRALMGSALALTACSAPGLGDPSWQTSKWCVDPALVSNTSDAANVWHAAAPRIDVQVVSDLGGNDCDGRVRLEAARTPGAVGGADPGEIRIDPREDWVQYRTSFIAHELGHHFLGAAYDGRDPYHPPSGPSLMVINASSLTVTADDVSRLP